MIFRKAIAFFLSLTITLTSIPFVLMAENTEQPQSPDSYNLQSQNFTQITEGAFLFSDNGSNIVAELNTVEHKVNFLLNLKLNDNFIENNAASKTAVSAKFELNTENLTFPDRFAKSGALNTKTDNKQIGTYDISKTDNKAVISVTFDTEEADDDATHISIYTLTDVTAGVSFTLEYAEGATGTTPSIDITANENSVIAKFENKAPPLPTVDDDEFYTIEKSVLNRDNNANPNIDYEISVNVLDKVVKDGVDVPAPDELAPLDAMTITDTIPEGLVVTGVYLGDTLHQLTSGSGGYTLNGNTITYTVPDTAPDTTAVKLIVNKKLDINDYKALCSGKTTKTYTNTAALTKNGESTPFKTSNEADAIYDGAKFMLKDGVRDGDNGKIYEWTVTANTFCTGGTVWFVDHIENKSIHNYLGADGNIGYSINDDTSTAVHCIPSSPKPYSSLTTADLTSLTESSTKAVYYEYTENDVTDVILIIPVPSDKLNGQLKVKYKTTVATDNDYYCDDAKTLKNEAKMLWSTLSYGSGPGNNLEFDYSIDKNITSDCTLGKKELASYDEKTQIATWKFTLNLCGAALTGLKVTDVWNSDVMQLVGVYTLNGSTEAPIGTDTLTAPYYAIVEHTDAQLAEAGPTLKCDTLTINCGDIAADKLLTILVKTKITDPAIISQQANNLSVSNKAKLECSISGTPYTSEITATKTISNTIISKDKSGTYDYTNHSFDWIITANPNALPIKNGIISDEMPEGLELKNLVSVTAYKADALSTALAGTIGGGSITFDSDTSVILDYTYADGTLTFKMKNGESYDNTCAYKFVIKYSTTVTEEYRNTNFKDNVSDEFDNSASLTGNIAYRFNEAIAVDVSASDVAEHTVTAPPIVKTNTGNGTDSATSVKYANWKVVINPDRLNMSGVTVTDIMQEWYSLDTSSVKIYAGEVSKSGVITATDNEITTGLTASENGLIFAIPESYKTTPIVITFRTDVVSYKAGMSNSATLSWNDGGANEDVPSLSNANIGTFNEGDYATGVRVPKITVVNQDSANSLTLLSGTEFKCEQMKLIGGKWVADSDARVKTGTTNANGELNFTFLQYDRLYKITEITVPDLYPVENINTFKYFVIKKDNLTAVYPSGTTVFGSDNSVKRTLVVVNYLDPADITTTTEPEPPVVTPPVSPEITTVPEVTTTISETTTETTTAPVVVTTELTTDKPVIPIYPIANVPCASDSDAPDEIEITNENGDVIGKFHKVYDENTGEWIYVNDDGVPLSDFYLNENPNTAVSLPLGLIFGAGISVLIAISASVNKKRMVKRQ